MRTVFDFNIKQILVCSLAACGSQEQKTGSSTSISTVDTLIFTEGTESSETEGSQTKTENMQESEEDLESSPILIIYFSRYGNTEYPDDVDATTSASIVVGGNEWYGTTEHVANLIRQTVDGDVHQIETVTPYTVDFDELRDVNHEEMQQGFLPELKLMEVYLYEKDNCNLTFSVYDFCPDSLCRKFKPDETVLYRSDSFVSCGRKSG